jgi:hypothetical protein
LRPMPAAAGKGYHTLEAACLGFEEECYQGGR